MRFACDVLEPFSCDVSKSSACDVSHTHQADYFPLPQATSQLDANSEHSVQEALQLLMKDRTVLIIAHRLSTIKNASKICVFAEGKIAEQVRPKSPPHVSHLRHCRVTVVSLSCDSDSHLRLYCRAPTPSCCARRASTQSWSGIKEVVSELKVIFLCAAILYMCVCIYSIYIPSNFYTLIH